MTQISEVDKIKISRPESISSEVLVKQSMSYFLSRHTTIEDAMGILWASHIAPDPGRLREISCNNGMALEILRRDDQEMFADFFLWIVKKTEAGDYPDDPLPYQVIRDNPTTADKEEIITLIGIPFEGQDQPRAIRMHITHDTRRFHKQPPKATQVEYIGRFEPTP